MGFKEDAQSAIDMGLSPGKTLDALSQNPKYKNELTQLKNAGVSPDRIFGFTPTPMVTTPEGTKPLTQEDITMQKDVAEGYLGGISMGLVPYLARKTGLVPPSNGPVSGANIVGQVMGGIGPGLTSGLARGTGSVLTKLIPALKTGSMLKTGVKLATEGAVIGGAYTPQKAQQTGEGFVDLPDRTKQAAVGVGTGLFMGMAGNFVKNVTKNIKNTTTTEGRLSFQDKVLDAKYQVGTDAMSKYGKELEIAVAENPKLKIDMVDELSQLKAEIKDNAVLDSFTKKSRKLRNLIDKPKSVTIKELDGIIGELNQKLPTGNLAKRTAKGLVTDLKLKLVSEAPNMSGAKAEYKDYIEAQKLIKNSLKQQNIAKTLKSDFEGNEQLQRAADEYFAKYPELLKEMGGYKNAMVAYKILAGAGILGATTGVGALLIKMLGGK